ncbi:MAG: hypothetical protein WC648_01330 [Candidatus Paceibacterota bacterium]|jgi:hypothetical protein
MSKSLVGKTKSLEYVSIESQIKFLQGKVLTIVDASITGIQNKAIKDLINRAFSEQLTWIAQLCYPELPITSRDALIADGVDVDAVERGAVEVEL